MAALTMADPARADIFHSMYGYGGHGASLPPPVVLTSTWWDEQKIEETVCPRYIRERITDSALRRKLEEPLKFGEGLTEATYSEWIVEHARKFFLILCDLGCPEYIFNIIDGSWDDEDLPLSMATIERLELPAVSQDKKFAKKQYSYLVRELVEGQHTDFEDEELVPLEVMSRRTQPGLAKQTVEKVYFPRSREVYYSRRRVPLGYGSHQLPVESFLEEIETLNSITHEHIVKLHLSYTHENVGFLVLSPALELNIKSFVQYPPTTWKSNTKEERRRIIFNWMLCLSDALAYLYDRGIAHGDIKPSSIIIEQKTHRIFLSDIGNSKRLDPTQNIPQSPNCGGIQDMEAYEYGAPELWQRTLVSQESSSPPTNTIFSGRTYRKSSTHSEDSISITNSTQIGQWTAFASNPSKSDVFSLACIFLEILTFQAKRKTTAFASHRSHKNRRSRESAPPDSSFHSNLGQVETWITDSLMKDARKKMDIPFSDGLGLCREMLQRDPENRPDPRGVVGRLYHTVVAPAVAPELPHCGGSEVDVSMGLFTGWKDESGRSLSTASSLGRASKRSTISTINSSDKRWMAI